jgi:hypothetical protein
MRTLTLAALFGIALTFPPDAAAQEAQDALKIGTFDSRAVALAYYRTPGVLDEMVGGMREAREEALAAGDTIKAEELDLKGPSLQHLMHQQVFSTGSICNLFPEFEGKLERIAVETGVLAIVSKWELPYSAPDLEIVDVTDEVVALFEVDEQVAAMLVQMREQDPVPLEEMLYDPEH